jgi:hypothetical protein
MAINNLKTEVTAAINKIKKDVGDGFYQGPNTVLDIKVGGKEFTTAYISVTQKVIDGQFPKATSPVQNAAVLVYNTPYYWNKALKQTSAEILTAGIQDTDRSYIVTKIGNRTSNADIFPVVNKGIHDIGTTGSKIELSLVGENKTTTKNVLTAIKNTIWDNWVRDVNSKLAKKGITGSMPESQDPGVRTSGSSKSGFVRGKVSGLIAVGGLKSSHTKETSKGAQILDAWIESAPALSLPTLVNSYDLATYVRDSLNIEVARKRAIRKSGGGGLPEETRFISVRLATNKPEPSDIKGIKERAGEYITEAIQKAVDGGLLADSDKKSSRPLGQDIADEGVIQLLIPLTKKGSPDKRYKIVKNLSAKQFKGIEDSIPVITSKGSKFPTPKRETFLLRMQKQIKKEPVEKGVEGDTADLLKLKSTINKRLPAEVRRNMGVGGALVNRTGNFSNSVELKSLRYTKAGISGDYTYTRSGGGSRPPQPGVYETFENTGKKQWPTGYNPKPLIAKSIRKLAEQYTRQKFTQLRRV